jgi:hypothetical protein
MGTIRQVNEQKMISAIMQYLPPGEYADEYRAHGNDSVAATRAAAILAVGFSAGYITAELTNPIRPTAVPQRLVPGRPATPPSGYFSCQAADVRAGL